MRISIFRYIALNTIMHKVLKFLWLRTANHTRKYMYKDNSYNYTLFDIIITLGAFWISIFALDKVSNTPYLDCTSNLLNMCNYVVRKISFPLSHHVIIVFINIQKCILGYTIIIAYDMLGDANDVNHVSRFLHGQNILHLETMNDTIW